MADKTNTDPAKNAAKDKQAAKPRAKRATGAVDAEALYPLPPSSVDERNVEVLSERTYGDQTVRVVTDGNNVWKEVA